ncbi:MAG: hypothetical protein QNJ49_12665 [Mastigocoleus sp. MO_167.B18]|nr:hypothetical protein [Mastigocoleus sp. MO_167.B18]
MKGKLFTLFGTVLTLALAGNAAVVQAEGESKAPSAEDINISAEGMEILCEKTPWNSRCEGSQATTGDTDAEKITVPADTTDTTDTTTPDVTAPDVTVPDATNINPVTPAPGTTTPDAVTPDATDSDSTNINPTPDSTTDEVTPDSDQSGDIIQQDTNRQERIQNQNMNQQEITVPDSSAPDNMQTTPATPDQNSDSQSGF